MIETVRCDPEQGRLRVADPHAARARYLGGVWAAEGLRARSCGPARGGWRRRPRRRTDPPCRRRGGGRVAVGGAARSAEDTSTPTCSDRRCRSAPSPAAPVLPHAARGGDEQAVVASGRQVEAVEVHHLGPSPDEGVDEGRPRVVGGVGFRQGAQLRVRPEDQIDPRPRPLGLAGLAVLGGEDVIALRRPRHAGAGLQQVDEEVVGQHARTVGEDPQLGAADVGAQHPQAADQHRHLRR